MESLRWILLVVGIVFVLVIYLYGRNRRRKNNSYFDDTDYDLPEFSAGSLDDVDEGVGEVKIITDGGLMGDNSDPLMDMEPEPGIGDDLFDELPADDDIAVNEDVTVSEKKAAEQPAEEKNSNIIVLYILPKANQKLIGGQINSSAQALGMKFGEMNIYHYKSGDRIIFSLANMLEPGSFDPEIIHDLTTSGITVFMQISGNDPMDDLTEMLQRSYQLAGLLDARLCNHRRQPMTEQDAENYRTKVNNYISRRETELAGET